MGSPNKVDERTMEVSIKRTNRPDMVFQLHPEATEEQHGLAVTKIDTTLTTRFGQHCDYGVINAAFVAMAPPTESWIARIIVKPPFLLGDLKDVLVFTAKNAADVLIVIPLRTVTPVNQEKAQLINLWE